MPSSLDIFKSIKSAWKRRPDPTAASTIQQIAKMAVGTGTAQNAALAGRVMADHRGRLALALFFVPGMYLALALCAGLILAVAGGLSWLLGSLFEYLATPGARVRIPMKGVLGYVLIMVGCAIGLWQIVRAGFLSVRRIRVHTLALPICQQDAPDLFRLLGQIGARLECRQPESVVIELGTSFFVTEAEVHTVAGHVRGQTLCLSGPLLRLLTVSELTAVLVHELSHFTGADTFYSRRFYPVYRGASEAIAGLRRVADADGEAAAAMSVGLWVPLLVLERYLAVFRRLESRIGRARELRADSIAPLVTSPQAVASSLTKAIAAVPLFRSATAWFSEQARSGHLPINLSAVFADGVARSVGLKLDPKMDNGVTHPTDSHPCLEDRLRAIGVAAVEVDSQPAHVAADLVPCLEAVERRLTKFLGEVLSASPAQSSSG